MDRRRVQVREVYWAVVLALLLGSAAAPSREAQVVVAQSLPTATATATGAASSTAAPTATTTSSSTMTATAMPVSTVNLTATVSPAPTRTTTPTAVASATSTTTPVATIAATPTATSSPSTGLATLFDNPVPAGSPTATATPSPSATPDPAQQLAQARQLAPQLQQQAAASEAQVKTALEQFQASHPITNAASLSGPISTSTAFGPSPTPTATATFTPPGPNSLVASLPTPTGVAREVPEKRTQTSRTFQTQSGSFATQFYPASIHYQDAAGMWQPIDNSLVASTRPGFAHQNGANRFQLHLPDSLNGNPVRLSANGQVVGFTLQGAGGASGTVSGSQKTYANAFANANVTFEAQTDGVKETVRLASVQAPHVYTATLYLSQGLTARGTTSGAIELVDSAGRVQFAIPHPYLADSATPQPSTTPAVTVTLGTAVPGQVAGTTQQLVQFTLDNTWLAEPARVWPVLLDPSLTVNTDGRDTFIVGGPTDFERNTSYASYTYDHVGYWGGDKRRSLLLFYLASAIPSNAQVLNAELGLYYQGDFGGPATSVELHQVTRDWTLPATWNSATGYGGTNWTSQGGDFNAAPEYTVAGIGGGSAVSIYRWYPTKLVQGWVNGTIANQGALFKQSGEATSNLAVFANSRSSTGWQWPYLYVVWQQGTGRYQAYPLYGRTLTNRMGYSVNVANGNLVLQEQDLHLDGVGLGLTLERFYNLYSTTGGPTTGFSEFSSGWEYGTGLGTLLEGFNDGSMALHGPSGWAAVFQAQPGAFLSPPGLHATLTRPTGTTFQLTMHATGTVYTFTYGAYPTAQWPLTSVRDRNGHQLSLQYTPTLNNQSLVLTSISDTAGRTITFTHNASYQLTSVSDSSVSGGRTVTYTYDGNGRLAHTTAADGAITYYGYDSQGRLGGMTDPNGHAIGIVYDSQGHLFYVDRLDEHGNHDATRYYYYNGYTVAYDERWEPYVYYFDAQGRQTNLIDPVTKAAARAYTPNWDVSVLAVYDGNNPTPTMRRTFFTYDTLNRLTQVLIRDGNGVALGAQTTFTYPNNDPANLNAYLPATITQEQSAAVSLTASLSYDATTGNLLSSTDPTGQTTTYTYYTANDSQGRIGLLKQVTAPPTSGQTHVTTYTYDWTGSVTSVTDPTGVVATIVNDSAGRPTRKQVGGGLTQDFTYDKLDRLLTATGYLNSVATATTYAYDGNGNRWRVTDPNGNRFDTYYTNLNWVASVGDYRGAGGTLNVTHTYSYDYTGNRTADTDVDGHTTSYTYDAVNRLTKVQQPGGNCNPTPPTAPTLCTSTAYDVFGNRTSTTDANQHVRQATYDLLNRVVTATDPLSRTTTRHYDYASNLTAIDLPAGISPPTVTFTYDQLNRLSALNSKGLQTPDITYGFDAAGRRTSLSDDTGTTFYGFDAAGRLTSAVPPIGAGTTYVYSTGSSGTGLRTSVQTSWGNHTTSYAYTDRGELKNVTDYQNRTTTYTYDNGGRVIGLNYPNGASTAYTYDAANNVKTISHATAGSVSLQGLTYTYDLLGLRTAVADYMPSVGYNATTSYTYDALNRLTGANLTDLNGGTFNDSASYAYDAVGNRTSATHQNVTTTYAYDQADQLTASSDHGGTTYSYDALGYLTQKATASAGTTNYHYNVLGRLWQVDLPNSGGTASYSYNGDGLRVRKNVNSVLTDYSWDLGSGRVLAESTAGPGTTDWLWGKCKLQ